MAADLVVEVADDGAVLTHRFWSASLERDPGVVGKAIQLGDRLLVRNGEEMAAFGCRSRTADGFVFEASAPFLKYACIASNICRCGRRH